MGVECLDDEKQTNKQASKQASKQQDKTRQTQQDKTRLKPFKKTHVRDFLFQRVAFRFESIDAAL
jgi:hypothetical protein